jgi:hypothetical protein
MVSYPALWSPVRLLQLRGWRDDCVCYLDWFWLEGRERLPLDARMTFVAT